MRPVSIVAFLACAGTLSCSGRLHAQDAPVSETPLATLADSNEVTAIASLKVRLQLEDQTPFLASASVRLLHTDSHEGQELLGFTKSTGELLFSGITSGKYLIAISAAGYQELRLITHLDAGPRQKTLFVPMKPKLAVTDEPRMQILQPSPTEPSDAPPDAAYAGKEPISASASPAESKDGAKHDPASANEAPPEPRANGQPDYWNPHELEEVPPVDLNIACPADELLSGVGQRVSEFVDTLERFAATEKLEHYAEQRDGARKDPETRTFAYVVSIKQNTWGGFSVDEYRNGGSTDPEAFPARTATLGSPAMALI